MRKELNEGQAIGKVIEGIYHSYNGQMVITLSDESFICYGIEKGYYDENDSLELQSLDIFDFGGDDLVKAGVLTVQEFENMKEKRNEKSLMEKENWERNIYESLLWKFDK